MNSLAIIAFCTCLAATNAGFYHGPSAKILQGPSSKTTVVGPDGSAISAVAPGGQIVHEEHPGFVAHAAPILSHATPAVAYASHSVAHHVPVATHAAPVAYSAHLAPSTVVAHSSAYDHDNVIVAGPSGSISTGQAHYSAPVLSHAAPIVAYGAPHVAQTYGHEGQYIHGYNEALYDDGSYKPHLYHH